MANHDGRYTRLMCSIYGYYLTKHILISLPGPFLDLEYLKAKNQKTFGQHYHHYLTITNKLKIKLWVAYYL